MTTASIDRKTLALAAHGILSGLVAAGVTEQGGNNLGEEVEIFQRARGGEPGESWCLDVQEFVYLKALANLLARPYTHETIVSVCQSLHPTLAKTMAVTGSCGALMVDGKARGYWIDRDKITVIRQGWLILFAFTGADLAARVLRHVGMADTDWTKSAAPILTLEGNTSPDAGSGSQADGDGCYRKHRVFGQVVGVYATY